MNLIQPAEPRDLLEAIEWSYKLFLGREAESPRHVREHVIAHASIQDVRNTFMASQEFQKQMVLASLVGPGIVGDLVARFAVCDGRGEEGFWVDFLGVRTRCAYLPQDFARFSGQVLAPPDQRSEDIHDLAEWIVLLKAVDEAEKRGRFAVAELGAGWGPWLVAGARAAAIIGIKDVELFGVEGSREHVSFLHQHFRDNGIDPDAHRIVHGVVGTSDGVAHFPRLPNPAEDWGAKALFDSDAAAETEEVPCFSIDSLLQQHDTIDLLHCDIQGVEGEALPAAARALKNGVRRIVVGTHSREVEGRLIDFFAGDGWVCEHEACCKFLQSHAGTMDLIVDGCQIWRNRAFDDERS